MLLDNKSLPLFYESIKYCPLETEEKLLGWCRKISGVFMNVIIYYYYYYPYNNKIFYNLKFYKSHLPVNDAALPFGVNWTELNDFTPVLFSTCK